MKLILEAEPMEVKETLEKQLQLLSERSEDASTSDLVRISEAMCKIAETLQKDSEGLKLSEPFIRREGS